jgi:hypothetical protein
MKNKLTHVSSYTIFVKFMCCKGPIVKFYGCDYLHEPHDVVFSILLDDVENMLCFIITAQKAQLTSINNFFLSLSVFWVLLQSFVSFTDGQRLTLVSGDEARVSASNFLLLLRPMSVLHC